MLIIIFLVAFIFTGSEATCQNLIGYNCKEIREYMKKNCRQMNPEKLTNNQYKYLKYSDNSESQTILFFLDNDSICKSVRLICDTGIRNEKIKEFDSIYKRSGKNRWLDNRDGVEFFVEMKDEKWTCVISFESEK